MEQIIMVMIFIFLSFTLPLECRTRKPAVSGRWYPSDPNELKNELGEYLNQVRLNEKQCEIDPLGIIVPHAGYMFSAPVAAYSYKLLEGKEYDTVIILGSSHHYFEDVVTVYDGDYLQTPLGEVAVDKEITEVLIDQDERIGFYDKIHQPEHSNEVQLPFLQYILKDFKVVSILTSTNDRQLLNKTSQILYEIIKNSKKRILLVNSTDMSHYHSYDNAKQIDRKTIELILAEDWQELRKKISYRECELCGFMAFEIFQQIMEKSGSGKPHLLHYANSGDAHPEYGLDQVVGYGAIVFPRNEEPAQKSGSKTENGIKEKDKVWLLNLARRSIMSSLNNESERLPIPENRFLSEKRAVFVTLHKNGELRGCIGHMIARDKLYQAVWEMARSAAFNDPRFPKVGKSEMNDINIEISILTPMKKISSIDEIVMGRDGVMIQQGYRSGVFLPQVAKETGWDKETFLQHLCSSKAMLPAKAYLDPQTDIFIFQVDDFKEKNK